LQRARDFVEAHLDGDLSLTVLADIACLSPYHFSRSFKLATGDGLQRYVIQAESSVLKACCARLVCPLL